MAAKADIKSETAPEKVTVLLPKMSGEADTVFVGLNGKSWLIPRGKRVEVPKAVANILDNSDRMRDIAMERSEREKRKAKEVQGI